nr:trypsin-like peptidase domain-containing protein [Streptomyces sp. YIM 130001]
MAATVRIHRPGVGYAQGEPGTFLGSGFFVAPNWVLTCAHVALGGEGGEVVVVHGGGPGVDVSTVHGEVAATVPERAGPDARGNWPGPDLALVRLREPTHHECVYVSERPAAYFGEGTVFYAGWTVLGGEMQALDGPLTVQGTLGGWSAGVQLRLGHNDLPPGVSGGPVIDPVRGEVVGVLKSRSDRGSGGTCTGIEQLRALPVPRQALRAEHDDLYQAVFHAHDRYHRDRQRHPGAGRSTWTDVQSRLGVRPGRALEPDERAQLLGKLAELPPPVSTRTLLDLLESLPDFPAELPSPAPRAWRDGLGALYEGARQDGALELLLAYAMGVISAEQPYVAPGTEAAEQSLWEWVRRSAGRTGRPRLRDRLAEQHIEHLRRRQQPSAPDLPVSAEGDGGQVPYPFTLLEIGQRGWEPDHCFWRICVVRQDGTVVRLPEGDRAPLDDLPAVLAGPLEEAFRRCDEPGRPGALQVALPPALFGLDVDAWQSSPDAAPLGARRPVVVRCADRDKAAVDGAVDPGAASAGEYEEPGEPGEREARWRRVHEHEAGVEVLDCDDGLRMPVPSVDRLRGLPHGAVPVLCRYGDRRFEDDGVALARIVHGGFSVALWRRWRGERDAVCGEFHRRAGETVAGAGSAARLPGLVHELRAGLSESRPETYWADGITLFYDDPHLPLLGADDLLEAP